MLEDCGGAARCPEHAKSMLHVCVGGCVENPASGCGAFFESCVGIVRGCAGDSRGCTTCQVGGAR